MLPAKKLVIVIAAGVVMLAAALAMASVTYEYDTLHRLKKVTYDDDSMIVFTHDAAGNRTMRVMNTDPNTVYLSTAVQPLGSGSIARNPDVTWYPVGSMVELTATAQGFCTFAGWSGNVPAGHEQDNPLTITLDAYKRVVAHFNALAGDAEPDCDVDLRDFATLQRCFGASPVSGDCAVFDLAGDGNIDMDDFEQWSQAITGPGE